MQPVFPKRYQKGMTLVEVMVAMIIFVIGMVGGLTYFLYGRGHISQSQHRRGALQLASQKIEELKATDYSSITDDSDNITVDGTSYSRVWDESTVGDYKEITVTVSWNQGGTQEVELVSIIADK